MPSFAVTYKLLLAPVTGSVYMRFRTEPLAPAGIILPGLNFIATSILITSAKGGI